MASYERCFRRHAERLALEQGLEDPTPSEIVVDRLLWRPDMSMATWHFQKSAALYAIETYHPGHHEALEQLHHYDSGGLARHSANTAGEQAQAGPGAGLG